MNERNSLSVLGGCKERIAEVLVSNGDVPDWVILYPNQEISCFAK